MHAGQLPNPDVHGRKKAEHPDLRHPARNDLRRPRSRSAAMYAAAPRDVITFTLIANVGSRRADLFGHLQDRLGDGAGPVLVNGVAAASDHDVAALRRGGSQACLQAGPVRPQPPWETPGGAEHVTGTSGKGRGARRRSPYRDGRLWVAAAQLVRPARAGEPEHPPGRARQNISHLLMRGIDQHQPGHQVRSAPRRQLHQDAAPAMPGQHAGASRVLVITEARSST